MRILEELYFGNLDVNTFMPQTSNERKVMKEIVDNENALMAMLEGKEKGLFLNFVNAQGQLNAITAVEKFIAGFTLGAMLLSEVNATVDDMVMK